MSNERAAESGNAIRKLKFKYKLRINVIKVNQNLDRCCGHLGRRFAT